MATADKIIRQIVLPGLLLFFGSLQAQNYYQFPCFSGDLQPVIDNATTLTVRHSHCIDVPPTNQTLDITGTRKIDFKAGKEIHLGPGFSARDFFGNGYFRAQIVPLDFEVVIYDPDNPNQPTDVPKFEKFEMGLKLPDAIMDQVNDFLNDPNTGINPFDPDELDITAVFSSPSNVQHTTFGFYYQDYHRHPNGTEWINDPTPHEFRVRFAPDELGLWEVDITVDDGNQVLQVNDLGFECVPSNNPGYLEIGSFGRQLRYSDTQESFFAIGLNVHGPTGNNIPWLVNAIGKDNERNYNYPAAFEQHYNYISSLGNTGANSFRLIMYDWGHKIEQQDDNNINQTIEGGLGNYGNRMEEAWELDEVFKIAKQKGLKVFFVFDTHGMYKITNHPFNPGNPSHTWWNNPYRTGNQNIIPDIDGPLDFFTDADCKKFYKKRLRYYLARYGWSTSIMAYEIFSEIDGVDLSLEDGSYFWKDFNEKDNARVEYEDSPAMQDAMFEWTKEMAKYVKNTFGARQLVSASFASTDIGPVVDERIFKLIPEIEFTSMHRYGNTRNINIDNRYNANINFLDSFAKPTFYSELGSAGHEIDECIDVGFHNNIWSTSMMGTMGCGMNWHYWEAIFPGNYLNHFNGLATFMNSIDFESDLFLPQIYPDGVQIPINKFDNSSPFVEAFTSKRFDNSMAFGWAHNRTEYWGNYLGSNSCLSVDLGYQQVGSTRFIDNSNNNPNDDINDDDSSYTTPVNLSQFNYSFNIEGLTPSSVFNNVEYLISFFSTNTGLPIAQDIRSTGNNGTLEITPPPTVINEPDFAYQLFRIDNKKGGEKDSLIAHFDEAIEKAQVQEGKTTTRLSEFEVYPNPTTNQLNIVNLYQNAYMNIYDATGRTVHSMVSLTKGMNSFNNLFISNGVYMIEIIGNDNLNQYKKLIVK